MKLLFSGYPAGTAGVGLSLLRIDAALMVVLAVAWLNTSEVHWFSVGLAIVALLLFLGFCTRIVTSICVITALCVGVRLGGWPGAIAGLEAINFTAIALLGPGAFSIDALLFGRRVIKLGK